MKRTSALLRGPQALTLARELRIEVLQYGKRQPKPLAITILRRRVNQPDVRVLTIKGV